MVEPYICRRDRAQHRKFAAKSFLHSPTWRKDNKCFAIYVYIRQPARFGNRHLFLFKDHLFILVVIFGLNQIFEQKENSKIVFLCVEKAKKSTGWLFVLGLSPCQPTSQKLGINLGAEGESPSPWGVRFHLNIFTAHAVCPARMLENFLGVLARWLQKYPLTEYKLNVVSAHTVKS